MTLPFEHEARERLGPALFSYLMGRPPERWAERDANHKALSRYRLVPRVLTGTAGIATRAQLLRADFAAPFGVGAFAGDRIFHRDGLLPIAAACDAAGLPLVVSEETVTPLAEIAGTCPSAWLQLRAAGPVERILALVDTAAACGVRTVVLTVLAPTHPFPGQMPGGYSIGAEIAARGWTTIGSPEPGVAPLPTFPQWSWAEIATVAAHAARSGVEIVLKGILSEGDARRALEAGCGALMVSNIGLRQTEAWVPACDALRAMGGRLERGSVILDGGIRRGSDVVKVLCLGGAMAIAVRPFVTALVAAGQDGVAAVIRDWCNEIAATAAWMGVPATAELDATYLHHDGGRP